MQPTPSGSGNFSGGGGGGGASGELNRIGLARFRSAPATWLEALLEGEEEEEEEETLKPNQSLTQLLSSNTPAASRNSASFGSSSVSAVQHGNLFEPLGFQRQNSSPADFLGNSVIESDGYFPNFGIPASYDYVSPGVDVSPSSKLTRDAALLVDSPKFPSLLKGEQTTTHGLMDMEMDKLMEDSVPCRVRAKRGCATHPRSIAERVRRTRISDRIRKLQELVPNMDKQTNTADMLDEAVEYVKFLQKQIQDLTEHQRRCTCVVKE